MPGELQSTGPPTPASKFGSWLTQWGARERADSRFALIVTALFLLVGGFAAAHHEVWSDEFSSWLLARDADSLAELSEQARYQGHPILWFLLLMPLTRLTWSPVAMQALHLAIAAGSVYVLASRAPFPRAHRLLLAFSYFLLFEYGVLCRMYAPMILPLLLFCALYQGRRLRVVALGATLFVMSQAMVYGVIFAVAGAAAVAVELHIRRRAGSGAELPSPRRVALGLGLAGLGAALSVLQLLPNPDYGFGDPWRFDLDFEHLARVLQILPRGFLPLPSADLARFWWPDWPSHPFFVAFGTPLSILLLLWLAALFAARPAALTAWTIGTGGLLAFAYTKHYGYLRHHGLTFVFFIAALWLAASSTPRGPAALRRVAAVARRPLPVLLGALLVVQVFGTARAIRADRGLEFSSGKRTAEFIRDAELDGLPMVGEWDHAVSTVVGYLEKEYAYWVRGRRKGSFTRWDRAQLEKVTPEGVVRYAAEVALDERSDVLLVLNSRLPEPFVRQDRVREVASFEGAVVPYEDFWVYRVPLDRDSDGVADDRDPEPEDPRILGDCRDLSALARRLAALPDAAFVGHPETGRGLLAELAVRAARQCHQARRARSAHFLRQLLRVIDGRPSPPDWVARRAVRRPLARHVRRLLAIYDEPAS